MLAQDFNPYRWFARRLAVTFRTSLDPTAMLLERHRIRQAVLSVGEQPVEGVVLIPPDADGSAVCFVHGVAAGKLTPYYRLIESLLEAKKTVLYFEYAGHGDCVDCLTLERVVDYVPAALDFLKTVPEVDPTRIGLMGVSLGSVLSLKAAAEHGNIKALCLLCTPLSVRITELTKIGEATGVLHPALSPILFDVSLEKMMMDVFFSPVRFSEEKTFTLLDDPFYTEMGDLITALDPLGSASRVEAPVRLIHGAWDRIVSMEMAETLFNTLAGPADLVVIPQRTHFTMVVDPRSARAAAEWFKTHLQP